MADQKENMKNIISGTFFVVGILLIVLAVFMIGKNRGLTQPKFQIDVLFSDVGGLIEGAPVQLAGVNVGTVSDISFLKQEVKSRRVRVKVNIFNRYRNQLKKKIRFAIKNEGILGEKLIKIYVGESGQKIDFNQPVLGANPLNVQDLAQVFADAAESFTKTSDDFNKIDVQELSDVLSDTAQSLTLTSRGINDILTEMNYISIKSKRLLDRLEQKIIDDDLFKVF